MQRADVSTHPCLCWRAGMRSVRTPAEGSSSVSRETDGAVDLSFVTSGCRFARGCARQRVTETPGRPAPLASGCPTRRPHVRPHCAMCSRPRVGPKRRYQGAGVAPVHGAPRPDIKAQVTRHGRPPWALPATRLASACWVTWERHLWGGRRRQFMAVAAVPGSTLRVTSFDGRAVGICATPNCTSTPAWQRHRTSQPSSSEKRKAASPCLNAPGTRRPGRSLQASVAFVSRETSGSAPPTERASPGGAADPTAAERRWHRDATHRSRLGMRRPPLDAGRREADLRTVVSGTGSRATARFPGRRVSQSARPRALRCVQHPLSNSRDIGFP